MLKVFLNFLVPLCVATYSRKVARVARDYGKISPPLEERQVPASDEIKSHAHSLKSFIMYYFMEVPMKPLLSLSLAVALSASIALSQSSWMLDKAHSSVTFTVSHMVISEVSGKFKDIDIILNSSKDDFADASVESVIKVASISTDSDKRDEHLRSDDFFGADKFPEIRFKSTAFEKVGENHYTITGDLTIRDVTKRVAFDATLKGSMKAMGKTLSVWKATTTVNRFDYNLKWNMAIEGGGFIVGKDVTIVLNLELAK
jgi:polyisoprenoid-binding protein YceI